MSLHLAFSAWAMRDLPLEQQLDIVRRAGYVGICLVSDPHFNSLDPATTSPAERRRVVHAQQSAGEPGHRQNLSRPKRQRAGAELSQAQLSRLLADETGRDAPGRVGHLLSFTVLGHH